MPKPPAVAAFLAFDPGPSFWVTVSALALGQLLSWAALYYAFSSFVLPMQHALGWGKPLLMGAFTLGLAVFGAAIDRGHGQAVMWAHVMPAFAAKGVSEADALLVLVCIGPAQMAGRLLFLWLGRSWSLRTLGAVVLTGLRRAECTNLN